MPSIALAGALPSTAQLRLQEKIRFALFFGWDQRSNLQHSPTAPEASRVAAAASEWGADT